MILTRTPRPDADRVTLDQLIRHNARRAPDQVALVDAPDRPLWSDGAPRRLTWAQVETTSNAIASRLSAFGLPSESVVAIQGPNSTDTIIAMMGCLKADLVPAIMPLGWRNAECANAIERVNARAIIAATRIGPARPAEKLREVAAENFAIRFVCSLGGEAPDGVVSLDDAFVDSSGSESAATNRPGNAADHVAIITFDGGPNGSFPVARSHNEWLAAGLSALSALELSRDSILLGTLAPCTLAGIGTGLMPWLLSGSSLIFHQAFDATVLGVQIEGFHASHLVLPAIVLDAGLREGLLETASIQRIMAVSRPNAPALTQSTRGKSVVEAVSFGEIGLIAGARSRVKVPLGAITAPFGVDGAAVVLETTVNKDGMLMMRGPMVPMGPLTGAERGSPYPIGDNGWVATGYPAAIEDGAILIRDRRQDVISIGGHTLSITAIESLYGDIEGAMAVNAVALPDPILGERLGLEAMPALDSKIGPVTLAMHAEAKGASPLSMTADSAVGDRRKGRRMAGAA